MASKQNLTDDRNLSHKSLGFEDYLTKVQISQNKELEHKTCICVQLALLRCSNKSGHSDLQQYLLRHHTTIQYQALLEIRYLKSFCSKFSWSGTFFNAALFLSICYRIQIMYSRCSSELLSKCLVCDFSYPISLKNVFSDFTCIGLGTVIVFFISRIPYRIIG